VGFPQLTFSVAADGAAAGRGHTRAMLEIERPLCRLQYAAGRVEECPQDKCPFWEPGGAALPGRCALERVDLSDRPEVAHLLLTLRKRLELQESALEQQETRRLFYRLLDTGDVDGG